MLQGMIFEKIETRILVGIVMFLGIMVLVGWVAINETARMQSFQNQFEARSIERGAKLFAANCATCHGADGRGIQGRAPALNSPHFFGFDFTATQKVRLTTLQVEQSGLEAERVALATELANVTSTRRDEINARLVEIASRLDAENPEGIPAQVAMLQEEMTTINTQLFPTTQKGYPSAQVLEANPEFVTRLGQAGWSNTLESYVFTTLVHGRAQNRQLWGGNVMVPWSRRGGGPFRDDQVQDVVNYVLNYDKGTDWTIEDALLVNQYAILPSPGGGGGGEMADAAGSDVDAILALWETEGIVGDAEHGKSLYDNAVPSQRNELMGCAGCHTGGTVGPATETTWNTFVNEYSNLPQFADYTPEKYLVESIVNPNAFIAPGYAAGVMLSNFGSRMSAQDLADIVAYLKTYSE